MSCLRKSPFHRKNVTKLLNHPYIKFQTLSNLEKSFDDVSGLNFEERPLSPITAKKPAFGSIEKDIEPELSFTPVKKPEHVLKPEKNHKADLLNILKKIQKQKNEENKQSKLANSNTSNQRLKSVSDTFRPENRQPNAQIIKSDKKISKKGLEIDFLSIESSKPINRLIIQDSSDKNDNNDVMTNNDKSKNRKGQARYKNRYNGENFDRGESFSDISSSEFV